MKKNISILTDLREEYTVGYRAGKEEREFMIAESLLLNPPSGDVDVVFRFHKETKGTSYPYAVVRLKASELSDA